MASVAKAGSMKRTPAPAKPASRIISSCVRSGHSAASARRRSMAHSDCRTRSCCATGSGSRRLRRCRGLRVIGRDAFLESLGPGPNGPGGEQRQHDHVDRHRPPRAAGPGHERRGEETGPARRQAANPARGRRRSPRSAAAAGRVRRSRRLAVQTLPPSRRRRARMKANAIQIHSLVLTSQKNGKASATPARAPNI